MVPSKRTVQTGTSDDADVRRRFITHALIVISGIAVLPSLVTAAEPDYAVERAAMVREIAGYAAEVKSATGRDEISPKVLEAMGIVPRHEFVRASERQEAYADRPLPIGYGQTISQPLIVALMTDLLHVEPDHIVL